ncbi:MAG: hypothetical protein JSW68_12855 [Burkholderiales bacterium]|nr:MAG: hypothetical protein JSW68_12855 [Burkholderiales bacterium]
MAQMIDLRLVYTKTDRGLTEVVERRLGLSPAARRMLILIDGRRALSSLPRFFRPGDVPRLIAELEAAGLVSLVGIDPAAADAFPEAQALERVRSKLARAFERELGASGRVLDARVRDCVSLEVMRAVLREAIDIVEARVGAEAARRLIERVRAALDEAADGDRD